MGVMTLFNSIGLGYDYFCYQICNLKYWRNNNGAIVCTFYLFNCIKNINKQYFVYRRLSIQRP